MSDWGTLQNGDEPVFVVVLTAGFADGVDVRYVVPVALSGAERAAAITRETPDAVIVAIGGARRGVMHTRLDGTLGRAVVNVMLAGHEVRLHAGRLLATRLDALEAIGSPRTVDDIPPAPLDTTRFQSHASFGERLMLEVGMARVAGSKPRARIADLPDESRPASRACRHPSRASTTSMPPASASPPHS